MPLTRYYIKEKRAKWHKNEYLTPGEWRLKMGWFVSKETLAINLI